MCKYKLCTLGSTFALSRLAVCRGRAFSNTTSPPAPPSHLVVTRCEGGVAYTLCVYCAVADSDTSSINSHCVKDMAASSFVAVDESYCMPEQVQLVVQEKLLWHSREDFTIVEARSKKPWFKLRGTAFRGPRRTKKFLDAQGNVLARGKEHPLAVPRRLFVQGSGFSFEVRSPYNTRNRQSHAWIVYSVPQVVLPDLFCHRAVQSLSCHRTPEATR